MIVPSSRLRAVFLSLGTALSLGATLCLSACQPAQTQADDSDEAALRKAGYSRAPQVTNVEAAGGGAYVVSGLAMPNGRVRFSYGGDRAIGVTADAKGRFRAPLPVGPDGGLYDLSIEDEGRLMHAEGRLFIPPEHPEKSVLIRPGAPSQSLLDRSLPIAVVDYDAAGAIAVSGHIATHNIVNVLIDGDIRAQVRPDDSRAYSALSQIAPPTRTPVKVAIEVQADGKSASRDISVSLPDPAKGDQMSAIPGGWRVDAALPGGGMQTILVF
jgi:hypothetical protein